MTGSSGPKSPPQGWYPDGTGTVRWWDGHRWTAKTKPDSNPPPTSQTTHPDEYKRWQDSQFPDRSLDPDLTNVESNQLALIQAEAQAEVEAARAAKSRAEADAAAARRAADEADARAKAQTEAAERATAEAAARAQAAVDAAQRATAEADAGAKAEAEAARRATADAEAKAKAAVEAARVSIEESEARVQAIAESAQLATEEAQARAVAADRDARLAVEAALASAKVEAEAERREQRDEVAEHEVAAARTASATAKAKADAAAETARITAAEVEIRAETESHAVNLVDADSSRAEVQTSELPAAKPPATQGAPSDPLADTSPRNSMLPRRQRTARHATKRSEAAAPASPDDHASDKLPEQNRRYIGVGRLKFRLTKARAAIGSVLVLILLAVGVVFAVEAHNESVARQEAAAAAARERKEEQDALQARKAELAQCVERSSDLYDAVRAVRSRVEVGVVYEDYRQLVGEAVAESGQVRAVSAECSQHIVDPLKLMARLYANVESDWNSCLFKKLNCDVDSDLETGLWTANSLALDILAPKYDAWDAGETTSFDEEEGDSA